MPLIASLAAASLSMFRKIGGSVITKVSEPYFYLVSLLMKGNTGTPLDSTATVSPSFINDASTNNLQLNITGSTKSDRMSPYLGDGFYSVQMNGTSDYLSVPGTNAGFNFSTNNFTIEGWFWTTTTTQLTLFEKRSGASYDWIVFLNATAGYLQIFLTGIVTSANATVLFPFGQWVHVALVRNGNVFTLYQNGVSVYTTTNAAAVGYNSAYPVLIGADASGPRFWWPGYISNVRIVNGTAVYTAPFVPPTTPLTAISGTMLLTCNNKTLTDKSSLAQVVTVNTTPRVSQASPFTITASKLLGSGYFNGTTDYISTPNNSAYQFGTGDFTVEFWWYLTSAFTSIQGPGIGQKAADANNGWVIYRNNSTNTDKISIRISSANSDYATTAIPAVGQWQHWAVTRSGTTLQWYCNGVACGTYTGVNGNASDTSGNMYVGFAQTWSYYIGASYMSDVRVVKGSALYTGTTSFTPPTQPLPAVANTQLLTLQYNGSHANSTFLDNSNTSSLVTRAGNATQGTFTPYGGSWCTYFNGSTDYLTHTSATGATLGTGDWTIEMWVYQTARAATVAQLYDTRPTGTGSASGYQIINISSTGALSYGTTGSIAGGTVPLNTWVHIAVSKQGSSTKLFLNGTQTGSTYTDTVNYLLGTARPIIGTDGNVPLSAGYSFTGYISNLRVVKGTALYTANFVPSTKPLTATTATELLIMNTGRLADMSKNNYTVVRTGTPRFVRSGPFSGSTVVANTGYFSTLFDGSSWVTTPISTATNIGTSDFTVEFWYYMTATATYGTVFNLGQYSSGIFIRIEGQTYSVYIVNTQVYLTGTAPLNTWVHLALVRSAGSLFLWANGVQVGTTVANTTSISPSAAMMIGASAHATGTERFFGYVTNLRLVIGTGLYTSAFTPPTTPLTAITGTAFLGFQNNTQIDNSVNSFNVNTGGGTPWIRNLSPFTSTTATSLTYNTGSSFSPSDISGSASFDGTGDYLTIPTNRIFSSFYTSSDFTVEAWFYLNNVTSTQLIISHRNAATGAAGFVPFLIWAATTNLVLYMSSNNSTWDIVNASNIATGLSPNCWYHVALCRSNGTVRAFLNGVQGVTVANTSTFNTTQPLQLGMSTGEAATALNGYISDARIVNGTALYTSNFIPPVEPLKPTKNTSLLLNFTNSGMYDGSGETNFDSVGAVVVHSTRKYGSSSLYFPGTSYLLGTYNPRLSLTGDFTIEMWIKGGTQTGTMPLLLSKNAVYSTGPYYIAYSHSSAPNKISLHNTTYGMFMTHNTTVTDSAWHHVAVVRSGTSVNLYVDGVSTGTPYTNSATWDYTTLVIGNNPSDGGATTTQLGYVGNIDDLRITNGYARYTGNFTPPSELIDS